jgi:aminoglycoside phosphotransferase (APT) family kinase protein
VRSSRRRHASDDLTALRLSLERAGSISPALPERLEPALRRAEKRLAETSALRPAPAHGDFRPRRLLFDRSRCALVGLDTFCSAEPALDLGTFTAQLALSAAEMDGVGDVAAVKALLDDSRRRLLDAYVAARQSGVESRALLARTRAYELLALLRLAVESWQELEADRLLAAVALLEQP